MGKNITVEICCGCAEDVIGAFEAGADRAELNSSLECGGLTSTVGALETAKCRADIPVICMVRPRAGGFCYTQSEFDTMLRDIRSLRAAGADGFAFGVLRGDGRLDEERCARLVEAAGDTECVFHRAFDVAAEPPEQLTDKLRALGIKRILTSGRSTSAIAGADIIKRCTGRGVEVLAGGGVRPSNAAELIRLTGVNQLHFSCHCAAYDRSASGNAQLSFAAPGSADRDAYNALDVPALRDFMSLLRSL